MASFNNFVNKPLFLFLLVILIISGCGKTPQRYQQPDTNKQISDNKLFFNTFAVQMPVIRIGLVDTVESSLTISSTAGLRLLDSSAIPVSKSGFRSVTFFIKGYDGSKPQTVFRVQTGSFSQLAYAEKMAADLQSKYNVPVVTPYNSQHRTYRVQAGSFTNRSDAASFQAKLRGDGLADTIVISEKSPVIHSGELNAVNIDGTPVGSAKRFIIIPTNQNGFLSIEKKRYRGAFELRIGEEGNILPINIVNLEDYLRGVVPAEMSSSMYPQLEALKAQTLAARTYAIRNMGQYSEKGFDICNTAACQVYKGVGIEQSMTDQAIDQTRYQIITYRGKPINALFSSTSGGHTEDVENIFPGDPVPYLKGVVSRPGQESVRLISTAKEQDILYGPENQALNYYIDVLNLVGYKVPNTIDPQQPPSHQLLTGLLENMAGQFGGRFVGDGKHNLRRIDILNLVTDALGWRQLVENGVSDLDVSVVFPQKSIDHSDYEKKLALYFLRFSFIKPLADGSLGLSETVTSGEVVQLFYSILDYQDVIHFERGNLINTDDGLLHLEVGRTVKDYNLPDSPALYQQIDTILIPVQVMKPVSGDMIRVFSINGTAHLLIHELSTQGLTNDRFSRYHHWDVSYSIPELNRKVAEYVDLGTITELRPLKRGVSNRIVALEIVGSKGSVVFKGLRIRWVLGLRDTLFTILKVFDTNNKQTGWRFIGSGWGHGVGLCQVGSYGMALDGASYDEIIRHFYTGVTIERIENIQ